MNTPLRELYQDFRRYKKLKTAPGTVRFYKEKLTPFMRWCEIQDPPIELANLHEKHIDQYLAYKSARGANAGGLNAIARAIRHFLRFAFDREQIERRLNVTMPPKSDYEPDFLTEGEIARLLDVIDTGESRMVERDYFLLSLMLDCGGRREAIVTLDHGDLTWDSKRGIGNVILIEKGSKPPTQSHFSRETWELYKVYQQWLRAEGCGVGPDDALVISYRDWKIDPTTGRSDRRPDGEIIRCPRQRLTAQGLHLWIKRLCERTGEDGWWEDSTKQPPVHIRLHGLRHTMGRRSAMVLPIRVVQRMMGHTNLSTTQIYTTPSADMVADAYAKSQNGNGRK